MALFATDKVQLSLNEHLYAYDDYVNYEVTGVASKVEPIIRKIGGADSTFDCQQLITPKMAYQNSNYLIGLCDGGRKITVFSATFQGINKDGDEMFDNFKIAKRADNTEMTFSIPKDAANLDPICNNLRNVDQFYNFENFVVSCKYGQKMFPYTFRFTHSSPVVDLIPQPTADAKVFDVLTGENAADELDVEYNLNCNFLTTICVAHDTFLNQDLIVTDGKKAAKKGIFLLVANGSMDGKTAIKFTQR